MSGQPRRRHFIDALCHLSRDALTEDGKLVFSQSSMADVEQTLQTLKEYAFDAKIILSADFYWRDYYAKDEKFLEEVDELQQRTGGKAYYTKGGKRVERIYVVEATKKPFEPNLKH